MSWQPIVVGVDGSPEGSGAAAMAVRIAARAETRCHLVHAARDVWASVGVDEGVGELRGVSLDAVRAHITAGLADAVPRDLVDTMTVRLGPTVVVLKQAVTDLGAELVVLGGKHHSAWGRWLGGSTSSNVARTTDVPVLVTAGAPPAIRRVLVAVDLSQAAGPTLRTAERYAANARRQAARPQRARAPAGHPRGDAVLRDRRILRHVGRAPAPRRLVLDPHAERGADRPLRDGGRDDPARSDRVGRGPVGRRVAWEGVGEADAGWQRDRATPQPPADIADRGADGGRGGRRAGGRATGGCDGVTAARACACNTFALHCSANGRPTYVPSAARSRAGPRPPSPGAPSAEVPAGTGGAGGVPRRPRGDRRASRSTGPHRSVRRSCDARPRCHRPGRHRTTDPPTQLAHVTTWRRATSCWTPAPSSPHSMRVTSGTRDVSVSGTPSSIAA